MRKDNIRDREILWDKEETNKGNIIFKAVLVLVSNISIVCLYHSHIT